ncbi:MAG: hypothetical protein IH789_06840 [Acidobacteria bacterium]|nr:hypothetical protein [Acidobacteriota bacterium]
MKWLRAVAFKSVEGNDDGSLENYERVNDQDVRHELECNSCYAVTYKANRGVWKRWWKEVKESAKTLRIPK